MWTFDSVIFKFCMYKNYHFICSKTFWVYPTKSWSTFIFFVLWYSCSFAYKHLLVSALKYTWCFSLWNNSLNLSVNFTRLKIIVLVLINETENESLGLCLNSTRPKMKVSVSVSIPWDLKWKSRSRSRPQNPGLAHHCSAILFGFFC